MGGTRQIWNRGYVAHRRESDGKIQPVEEHLVGVAAHAARFADKLGLALLGELLGLLHDLGKYSVAFQDRINGKTPESEKVDHATAGAQHIWNSIPKEGGVAPIASQLLALCIASHHGGLIDCVSPDGQDRFSARMAKSEELTHLVESLKNGDERIISRACKIFDDPGLLQNLEQKLKAIFIGLSEPGREMRFRFTAGLLLRVLFSCLIDADRTDTADFERPENACMRPHASYRSWDLLIGRLNHRLDSFVVRNPIDTVRGRISLECLTASERSKGIFTLTVPTGGGKTLASLRFALNHANKWKHDRIIYVVPFTTIIDQNAQETRDILEAGDEFASVVLEHHSNLAVDEETAKSKILSENWDAPVIYTTMVQVLEALFGAGTRSVRRMHQLLNSVIIFDEIQALPIKIVHLFCNALNFLVDHGGATAVLCTATQPLLNRVDSAKGAGKFDRSSEITQDHATLFRQLKRVEVVDKRKTDGWADKEISQLASSEMKRAGSCLIVVNRKDSARSLYELCQSEAPTTTVCHLSTAMCPAHRMDTLSLIEGRIGRRGTPPTNPGPLICVSTQLIEAGVDIDFGAAIRFLAGLDSIAQTAGRCNRNGRSSMGRVSIVNPREENLEKLPDIEVGRQTTVRILNEFTDNPSKYGDDLIGPQSIEQYFNYYFYQRKDLMAYPVFVERGDILLNMLSQNSEAVCEYGRQNQKRSPNVWWRQSFKSAAEAFQAIDAPTRGIIVPYGKAGQELIGQLCAAKNQLALLRLMRSAQRFSVNVFPWDFGKLMKDNAVHEVQEGTGILYVDSMFYNDEFGLDVSGNSEQGFLSA